jgi:hypothetical protein
VKVVQKEGYNEQILSFCSPADFMAKMTVKGIYFWFFVSLAEQEEGERRMNVF